MIPTVIDALGTVSSTGTRTLGKNRTYVDHPNYRIFEIDQNTEKILRLQRED